jgi:hypothetical protein
MMLVLDKSGSMVIQPVLGCGTTTPTPNTPKITRWNSLYQVVSWSSPLQRQAINFGANLFPSKTATATYNANACVVEANVEIPVAPMNKDAILNGIPQAGDDLTLKGGTPSSAGMPRR